MLDKYRDEKNDFAENHAFIGPYAFSYFKPYQTNTKHTGNDSNRFESISGFSDAKRNIKGIILYPLTDLYLAMTYLLDASFHGLTALINGFFGICTMNKHEAWASLGDLLQAFESTIAAGYFLISTIFDGIDCLLRLVTHSLSTLQNQIETVMVLNRPVGG